MRNNNEILDDDFREEEVREEKIIIPIKHSYEKENRHLNYAQGLIFLGGLVFCYFIKRGNYYNMEDIAVYNVYTYYYVIFSTFLIILFFRKLERFQNEFETIRLSFILVFQLIIFLFSFLILLKGLYLIFDEAVWEIVFIVLFLIFCAPAYRFFFYTKKIGELLDIISVLIGTAIAVMPFLAFCLLLLFFSLVFGESIYAFRVHYVMVLVSLMLMQRLYLIKKP